MKLSELKTRLKNKYVVRIVAGVLTIALLGSSMTAVAVQADQKKDAAVQTEQKEDSSDKKDDIEDLLQVSVSDKEIGKDENVYLISDATGSVYDTIVTDHLINKTDKTEKYRRWRYHQGLYQSDRYQKCEGKRGVLTERREADLAGRWSRYLLSGKNRQ